MREWTRQSAVKEPEIKPYSLLGIILILVSVAAFGYQSISYMSREKVVDLGQLQVTADKTRTLTLSPIVGGIVLIGWIALLAIHLCRVRFSL